MTNTPNPFDDNSVQQVNAFDSGAYGDAYEVNTGADAYNSSQNSGPPKATFGDPIDNQDQSKRNIEDMRNEIGGDVIVEFGVNLQLREADLEQIKVEEKRAVKISDNMQAMEVRGKIPDDQLERTCGGYSPGFLWAWAALCAGFLVFAGIFDLFLSNTPPFLQIIVNIYLMVVGFTLLMVEVPQNCINQRIQERVYKWARMLRRAWGKAFVYFFFAILCCTDTGSAKTGIGVVIMLISLGIWFIGWQTARILKRMVNQIIAGTELGTDDFDIILERKFRQLNNNSEKKVLTSEHIFNLGKECGFWLNSTEVWLITKFWDDNADGKIDLIEWKYGFRQIMTGSNYCKYL